jgi:hypothetical protein
MANTFDILADIVSRVRCKPGWTLRFAVTEDGPRLIIMVPGRNSAFPDNPEAMLAVSHYLPVPETTYNYQSWLWWVFEQCLAAERHEVSEWFRIGVKSTDNLDKRNDPGEPASETTFRKWTWPFPPLHGPGENPYTVHSYRDPADALITQDGSIRKPY